MTDYGVAGVWQECDRLWQGEKYCWEANTVGRQILLEAHIVGGTYCWRHILLEAHTVRGTYCWRHILLGWALIYLSGSTDRA